MQKTRIRPALLLALTVMLICLPLGALAATATQDGLAVTLTTDKAAYAAGEHIVARATVRNNNPIAVRNVRLEVLLPSGLSLKSGGGSAGPVTLAAGESASVDLTAAAPKGGGAIPPTGDDSPLGPLVLLALLAGGGALLLRALERRSAGRFFALLLCGVLACGVLAPAPAGAATEPRRFSVGENITAGGVGYGLTATVSYDWETGPVRVTGVTLSPVSLSLTAGGAGGQLTATVLPVDAADKNLQWSTSAAAVATVSQSGLVTPVGAGSCTVTVTTVDGGFTADCAVTVSPVPVPVTGVSLDASSITGWDMDSTSQKTLVATVLPNNATDRRVTWSSNATGVATVDDAGILTARGIGTCTITVTTADGGFTDSCAVTIGSKTASNAELAKITGYGWGTNWGGYPHFDPDPMPAIQPPAATFRAFNVTPAGFFLSLNDVGNVQMSAIQLVNATPAELAQVGFDCELTLYGVASSPRTFALGSLLGPGSSIGKLQAAKAIMIAPLDPMTVNIGSNIVKQGGQNVLLPTGVGLDTANALWSPPDVQMYLAGGNVLTVYSPQIYSTTTFTFSEMKLICVGIEYPLSPVILRVN